MPALLTNSELYMRKRDGAWHGRCFTCHSTLAENDNYAEAWRAFQTVAHAIQVRSHQLYVCYECYRDYNNGRLITTRLNKINLNPKRPKTRSSSFV